MGSRPANALTLDEVHARENIQTGPQHHRDGDQSAFNKLVAQLKSRPAQTSQESSPLDLPSSSSAAHSNHPLPFSSPQMDKKPNFGSQLELELDFSSGGGGSELDDVFISSPRTSYPPSLSSSTLMYSGSREELPRRLDHAPLPTHHSYSYPQYLNKASGHQMPPGGVPHDNWMSEVYPESQTEALHQYDARLRSAHQMASSRQQQMLASRHSANNWAIEIERRRVQELQHMQRERAMAGYLSRGGVGHHHMAQQKVVRPSLGKGSVVN